MRSVSIVGLGRMGSALAKLLPPEKYEIEGLIAREPNISISDNRGSVSRTSSLGTVEKISSDIVLITTQDSEIADAANSIKDLLSPGCCVFHTSGALSSGILEPLDKAGAFLGSIHPLVSISDREVDDALFDGVHFCVEGDAIAVQMAEELVHDLGGTSFSIATDKKPLYHAAAVTASGHLVALVAMAMRMLQECGIDMDASQKILLPLISSTIDNLRDQDPANALTGPFARADADTFTLYTQTAAKDLSPEEIEVFYLLGEMSLNMAANNGVSPERIADFRQRLSVAKANSK